MAIALCRSLLIVVSLSTTVIYAHPPPDDIHFSLRMFCVSWASLRSTEDAYYLACATGFCCALIELPLPIDRTAMQHAHPQPPPPSAPRPRLWINVRVGLWTCLWSLPVCYYIYGCMMILLCIVDHSVLMVITGSFVMRLCVYVIVMDKIVGGEYVVRCSDCCG